MGAWCWESWDRINCRKRRQSNLRLDVGDDSCVTVPLSGIHVRFHWIVRFAKPLHNYNRQQLSYFYYCKWLIIQYEVFLIDWDCLAKNFKNSQTNISVISKKCVIKSFSSSFLLDSDFLTEYDENLACTGTLTHE